MNLRPTPDLTGRAFGRLTALRRVPNVGCHAYWICRCECGRQVTVRSLSLRRGETRSCGCYAVECLRRQPRGPDGRYRSDARQHHRAVPSKPARTPTVKPTRRPI
jgi:hypothetical protein